MIQWHYNKDGDEIAGEWFTQTLRNFANVLYRFYSKKTSRGKFRPRLEVLESPRKTLWELAEITLKDNSDLA